VPGVVLKADIDAKFEASITTSDGINSGTTTVDCKPCNCCMWHEY
jgi:hypothetical protein